MLAHPLATALGFALEFFPDYAFMNTGHHSVNVTTIDQKQLHLYTPVGDGTDKSSVVAFIHGGHGQAGTILPPAQARGALSYSRVGHTYASQGITTALIGYPLCRTPDHVIRRYLWLGLAVAMVVATLFGVATWHVAPLDAQVARAIIATSIGMVSLAVCLLLSRRHLNRLAPVRLQTDGVNVDKQLAAVWKQLQALHARLGPDRDIVVVGHSHGALLGALALGQYKPEFVKAFVGIGGIYDLEQLRAGWTGLSGAMATECYLKPVFGELTPARLSSVSPANSPIRDETDVYLVNGYGESAVMMNQAKFLGRTLLQCRTPGCAHRANCQNEKHERRRPLKLVGPVGMGHGLALLMDRATFHTVRVAVSDTRADKKKD